MPALTTVDPGRRDIADVAVALLHDRLTGAAPAEPVLHVADMRIVERGSTPIRR